MQMKQQLFRNSKLLDNIKTIRVPFLRERHPFLFKGFMRNKIVILFLLTYLTSSCTEQDFFAISGLPAVNITELDYNSVSLGINTDTSEHLALLISKKDEFSKDFKFSSTVNKTDSLNYSKIKFSKKGSEIIFSDLVNKTAKISVINMDELQNYYIALYRKEKDKFVLYQKLKFSTVEKEPTIQAQNITFGSVSDSKMIIGFQPGNGKGRLVLIKKDTFPDLPLDGIDVKFSSFYGTDSSKVGNNTYCVFNSYVESDNKVTVTNLSDGKYYFAVIEYNGAGPFTNYLKTFGTNNLRFKHTSLKAPLALAAQIIDSNNFMAKWEKHPDVEYYILDVAEDENFAKIIEPYDGVDVGDSNIVEIQLPFNLNNRQVFYRLRAFSSGTITAVSNVIRVTANEINK